MACSGGSAGPCVLYPVRPRVAAGERRIGRACASRLRATASVSPSGYLREFSASTHGRIEGAGLGKFSGALAVQCWRGSTAGPSHPVRAGRPTRSWNSPAFPGESPGRTRLQQLGWWRGADLVLTKGWAGHCDQNQPFLQGLPRPVAGWPSLVIPGSQDSESTRVWE